VEKGSAEAEQRLDELYREHPERFVAGRNQLMKDLRAAGDRDQAERVKKLRRPSAAAWLLNRAALSSSAQMQEFVEASRQLEDAQNRALQGGEQEVAQWRDAAAREREATSKVLEAAERAAREAGHPPNERTLELADKTLRAAAADPDLRERVLGGRLEREQSAATLGTPAAAPPPKRDPRAAKRQEKATARRELERMEEDLAEATERQERLRARVDETAEALQREKSKLADSKREKTALKRRLKAAGRRTRR
jgi:hypothetical protein